MGMYVCHFLWGRGMYVWYFLWERGTYVCHFLPVMVYLLPQVGKEFDALLVDAEAEHSPFDCFEQDTIQVGVNIS